MKKLLIVLSLFAASTLYAFQQTPDYVTANSSITALWGEMNVNKSTDIAQWSYLYQLDRSTTSLRSDFNLNASTDTDQWSWMYQKDSSNTALWTFYEENRSTDTAQWDNLYYLNTSTVGLRTSVVNLETTSTTAHLDIESLKTRATNLETSSATANTDINSLKVRAGNLETSSITWSQELVDLKASSAPTNVSINDLKLSSVAVNSDIAKTRAEIAFSTGQYCVQFASEAYSVPVFVPSVSSYTVTRVYAKTNAAVTIGTMTVSVKYRGAELATVNITQGWDYFSINLSSPIAKDDGLLFNQVPNAARGDEKPISVIIKYYEAVGQ